MPAGTSCPRATGAGGVPCPQRISGTDTGRGFGLRARAYVVAIRGHFAVAISTHETSTMSVLYDPHPLPILRSSHSPSRPDTVIGFGSMAKLAVLLLLAVAASAAALAHGHDLPTRIKLIRGADAVALAGDSMECVYTVYIRTGSIWKAGTDSNITLELAAADGNGVGISDLPSWGGLIEQGHSYFERGNRDIFSGRGPCMAKAPCWMRVASDGTGPHHGWYCNYVEVTVTGPHKGCAQQLFTVEQWLATDAPPYKLEAVVNNCAGAGAAAA